MSRTRTSVRTPFKAATYQIWAFAMLVEHDRGYRHDGDVDRRIGAAASYFSGLLIGIADGEPGPRRAAKEAAVARAFHAFCELVWGERSAAVARQGDFDAGSPGIGGSA